MPSEIMMFLPSEWCRWFCIYIIIFTYVNHAVIPNRFGQTIFNTSVTVANCLFSCKSSLKCQRPLHCWSSRPYNQTRVPKKHITDGNQWTPMGLLSVWHNIFHCCLENVRPSWHKSESFDLTCQTSCYSIHTYSV